jgi:hypothetical protein
MLTNQPILVTWILGLLVSLTFAGLVVLLRQWQRGRLVIDGRQVLVRALGLVAMLAVWVLLGFMLLWISPTEQQRAFLLCYAGTALLALLLVLLAWLDLRLLALRRFQHEARLGMDLARLYTPQPPEPGDDS